MTKGFEEAQEKAELDLDLPKLPEEIWIKILSFLDIQDLPNAALTSQLFSVLIKDNWLWQQCYLHYFPHHFQQAKNDNPVSWKLLFQEKESQEYKHLEPYFKKLFIAAKEGKIQESTIQELSLEDFLQKDASGYSLLYWIKKYNDQQSLNLVYQRALKFYQKSDYEIDTKKELGQSTILHWAIFCHQPLEQIELLIQQDAKITHPTLLHCAVLYDNLPALNLLLKKLLEQGAEINPKENNGWTPLHCAANKGHLKILNLLLEKLLEQDAEINPKDNEGWTPLHWAAKNGHLEIVKLLLEKLLEQGAEISPKDDDGWTPLHCAAKYGHLKIFNLLLEKLLEQGAEISPKDNEGRTPLDWAARNGHLEVVKLLLEKRDNFLIYDSFGKPAENSSKNTYIRELLNTFKIKWQTFAAQLYGRNATDNELQQLRSYYNADEKQLILTGAAGVDRGKLLYELLTKPLIFDSSSLLAFAQNGGKEVVVAYIQTLGEEEQRELIESILKKETPLGEFFWMQRGWTTPKLGHGQLAVLQKLLTQLDSNEEADYRKSQTSQSCFGLFFNFFTFKPVQGGLSDIKGQIISTNK
ncbi:ankyrin repeat domain-containing protein [Legionella nautarum]|uniref:ankyrin repeat domain-containing protein n=1 Tax=Legionella nautarum TaxID=45070 RepID=UPI0010556F37|nr:ankyrin repeat domain-containing protein [Legionella nautarum]